MSKEKAVSNLVRSTSDPNPDSFYHIRKHHPGPDDRLAELSKLSANISILPKAVVISLAIVVASRDYCTEVKSSTGNVRDLSNDTI